MDYGFTHKTQLTMKIYILVVKAVILLCISSETYVFQDV